VGKNAWVMFTTDYPRILPRNTHKISTDKCYTRVTHGSITHRLSSDITHGQMLHADLPQIYYPQITHVLSTSITHYLSTDVYPRNIHGTYPRILPTDYPQLFYPRNCHRDFTHRTRFTTNQLPTVFYGHFVGNLWVINVTYYKKLLKFIKISSFFQKI